MPKKDPFSGSTNRFIAYYTDFEDLPKAATHAGLSLTAATKLYRDKAVRAEIDRRLDKLHGEQAKLIAKARQVTTLYLDDRLVEAVKHGAAKGDTKALELGYRRVGMFRDGEFLGVPRADQTTPKADAQQNMIYRATAVERTVTRTEQVTERAELGGEPPQATLPESPVRPAVVEILQY